MTTIRDAATVILLREGPDGPAVLMGQRGASAAFMPSKYVFPGGATEPGDAEARFARPLAEACRGALTDRAGTAPEAVAAAGLRELAEETGQVVARPWNGDGPGCAWPGFAGLLPDAGALRFVFRAITPPGRPRRFDARFFLADAGSLATDPDDFGAAEDELAHLHWVPLREARALDMPFITEVVLAEVAAIREGRAAPGVPFFDNRGETSAFRRLGVMDA
ncbi:NUDIX hydrolase [Jannaschia sp. W003]|uniref:NUDIX hydrolase n=1 Tax=Jannaschia sp. W003 TaxID=2867012 RepID=UPI0021A5C948|nr:NUDIX hydrolase [Jannaschia sp. W003]UWQ21155.1 NUDIX hydrolase [Jannaschia sp. W003]